MKKHFLEIDFYVSRLRDGMAGKFLVWNLSGEDRFDYTKFDHQVSSSTQVGGGLGGGEEIGPPPSLTLSRCNFFRLEGGGCLRSGKVAGLTKC